MKSKFIRQGLFAQGKESFWIRNRATAALFHLRGRRSELIGANGGRERCGLKGKRRSPDVRWRLRAVQCARERIRGLRQVRSPYTARRQRSLRYRLVSSRFWCVPSSSSSPCDVLLLRYLFTMFVWQKLHLIVFAIDISCLCGSELGVLDKYNFSGLLFAPIGFEIWVSWGFRRTEPS